MSYCRCGHDIQYHTVKGCSWKFYDMKVCQCRSISISEVKNKRLSEYRLNDMRGPTNYVVRKHEENE